MLFQEDEILGKAYDARLMRRLLTYLRPYRRPIVAAIILLLLTAVADLAGPYFIKVAIDRHISTGDIGGINRVAIFYLGTLVLGVVFRYGQSYITQIVGQNVMFDLRMELFTHLQHLAVSFFTTNPVGRLMTRITNDVDTLYEMVTDGVVMIFGDIFILVGIVVAMLLLDWQLALVAFAVFPPLVVFTLMFHAKSRATYRAIRVRIARINAYLNENIMGMPIVQLFNRERRNFARFDALNADYYRWNLKATTYIALYFPGVGFLAALATALVIWYGGGQVVQSAVTLGVLVAMLQYAERFFRPIQDLAERYNILQAAMASSERLFRVLDEPVTVRDPEAPVPFTRLRGEVEFRDIWFTYPAASTLGAGGPEESRDGQASGAGSDDWVLKGVSFRIQPGESVAFVGHTGAGKTSIINLITRFYDPQRGEVRVDGVDVRQYAQQALRRHIGLVLQDVFLFSGTIASNIRLGNREITDETIHDAAVFVNAYSFISQLPQGYATDVVERGATLSVGQRQLVAFARAVAHNPEILLVLDEATSSVDTETELLIQDALARVLRGRTSIIIAHRLSTIQNVDRIIVLHKGRIVEEGTHRQLLARGGVYSKLYQLQYRDQEVRSVRLPVGGEKSRDGRRGTE